MVSMDCLSFADKLVISSRYEGRRTFIRDESLDKPRFRHRLQKFNGQAGGSGFRTDSVVLHPWLKDSHKCDTVSRVSTPLGIDTPQVTACFPAAPEPPEWKKSDLLSAIHRERRDN